jgi:signal transduction histidine kinase
LAKQGLDEEQQRTLQRIMRSTDRLNRMVNDILDFARGRLGSPMPLALARTNLEALVRDVVDEIKITHPEVMIQFNSNGDTGGTWDAERLKQMTSICC